MGIREVFDATADPFLLCVADRPLIIHRHRAAVCRGRGAVWLAWCGGGHGGGGGWWCAGCSPCLACLVRPPLALLRCEARPPGACPMSMSRRQCLPSSGGRVIAPGRACAICPLASASARAPACAPALCPSAPSPIGPPTASPEPARPHVRNAMHSRLSIHGACSLQAPPHHQQPIVASRIPRPISSGKTTSLPCLTAAPRKLT